METVDVSVGCPGALERRLQQLEETNRLQNEFLAKLGHELGNLFLPYQFVLQLLRHWDGNPAVVNQVADMLEVPEALVQKIHETLFSHKD